ncbi:MAG TPA: peptide-methionine (R)-S-oxide reductase MsrB [Patescibacteria group bacterium]|nr:peptide-methionine (R)-S-oxide reductase MsrB [Patescibacteria group bacterium]
MNPINKSNDEWKKSLTPDAYHILREKGTERAFTGKYWNTTDEGKYVCAGCGQELFLSDTKYDAGCGWPSFYTPVNNETIETLPDDSLGMNRMEVRCRRCGGHLGHVFDDGPREKGGQRYCINSGALRLRKK